MQGFYALQRTDRQPQGHRTLETPAVNNRDPTNSFRASINSMYRTHTETSNITNFVPWHAALLHEKEKCILALEDKVKLLTAFEAESVSKDNVIFTLQEKIADLSQQLSVAIEYDTVQTQSKIILGLQEEIAVLKDFRADCQNKDRVITDLRDEIWQLGLQISHLQDVNTIDTRGTTRDNTRDTRGTTREDISVKKEEELKAQCKLLGLAMVKSSEEILKGVREPTNTKDEGGYERLVQMVQPDVSPSALEPDDYEKYMSLTPEEKTEELRKVTRQNEELRRKLEEMKEHYNMSTGAVISINRQLSLTEAQLRKAGAEVERLQKELKARCTQLQDMSNKFSNLKEENNSVKIMTDLQKENFSFRELVAELQSEQSVKDEAILGLKTETDKLQLHVTAEEVRKKRLQAECDNATSQANVLQHELQNLNIALKFTKTRLERFISKIVQAVYTTPGIVQPTTQVSDEDTLTVLQKILDDRLQFQGMLIDYGISVPPLSVDENPDDSQMPP